MKMFLVFFAGLAIAALLAAVFRFRAPGQRSQHATRKSANKRAHHSFTEEREESEAPEEIEEIEEKKQKSETYVMLHVIAPDQQPYSGYELLQSLLVNGLRYGKDKIFHRFEQKTGTGNLLFSLTTVNPPGTFDMPTMGKFTCPGLTLFFISDVVHDAAQAFEVLLQTAQQLVDDLGGEIWGADRQLLTPEAISVARETLQESLVD